MVRKYLKAARKELDMTQLEVAQAVGVTRNTIIKLENGFAVDEGIEGRVEKLYGWAIGSLDQIRDGKEPIPATTSALEPAPPSVPAEQLAVREMADCIIQGKDVGPLAKYWSGRLSEPDEIWGLIDDARKLAKKETSEREDPSRSA